MNDYTPPLSTIRRLYAMSADHEDEALREAAFDRRLAEVERAAAEKAWDDGRAEGFHRSGRTNPYRKETP